MNATVVKTYSAVTNTLDYSTSGRSSLQGHVDNCRTDAATTTKGSEKEGQRAQTPGGEQTISGVYSDTSANEWPC